jgi:NAD(P)-dependent dehydrogenase (short-subunit alcohol dehydrogenase family)
MTSNLRSTHLIAHHYACALAPSCTGAFISVISGADTVVVPGLSSYGIAKQAMRRLVESLPVEYPQLKVFELDPGIVRIRTVFDMGKVLRTIVRSWRVWFRFGLGVGGQTI